MGWERWGGEWGGIGDGGWGMGDGGWGGWCGEVGTSGLAGVFLASVLSWKSHSSLVLWIVIK